MLGRFWEEPKLAIERLADSTKEGSLKLSSCSAEVKYLEPDGLGKLLEEAHVGLRFHYEKELGDIPDLLLVDNLKFETKNPNSYWFVKLFHWLTILPQVGEKVLKRLNWTTDLFAQELYNNLRAEEKEKEKSGKDHQPWFLPYRKCSYPFVLAYGLSVNSYETRLISRPIENNVVWCGAYKVFKNHLATQLFSSQYNNSDYCLLSIDMSQCHARIVSGILKQNSPELARTLQTTQDNMWSEIISHVPGNHSYAHLKAFIKILFYKAINGGSIRKDLEKENPLKKTRESLV